MSEYPPRIFVQPPDRKEVPPSTDLTETDHQQKLRELQGTFVRAQKFLGARIAQRIGEKIQEIETQPKPVLSSSKDSRHQVVPQTLSIQKVESELARELMKICVSEERDQETRQEGTDQIGKAASSTSDNRHLLETAERYLESGQYEAALIRMCFFLEQQQSQSEQQEATDKNIFDTFKKEHWLFTSEATINSWISSRRAPEMPNNFYLNIIKVQLPQTQKDVFFWKTSRQPLAVPSYTVETYQSISEKTPEGTIATLYSVVQKDGKWTNNRQTEKATVIENIVSQKEKELEERFTQTKNQVQKMLSILQPLLESAEYRKLFAEFRVKQNLWTVAIKIENKTKSLTMLNDFLTDLIRRYEQIKPTITAKPARTEPEKTVSSPEKNPNRTTTQNPEPITPLVQPSSQTTTPRWWRRTGLKLRDVLLAGFLGGVGGGTAAKTVPKEQSLASNISEVKSQTDREQPPHIENIGLELIPETPAPVLENSHPVGEKIQQKIETKMSSVLLEHTLLRGESFKNFVETIKANSDLLATIGLSIPESKRVGLNPNQVFSRWLQTEMIRLRIDPRNGESQDGTVVHPGDQFFLEKDSSGIHIRLVKKTNSPSRLAETTKSTETAPAPKPVVESRQVEIPGVSFGDTVVYRTEAGKLGIYTVVPAETSATPGVILRDQSTNRQFFVSLEKAKKNIQPRNQVELEIDPLTKKVTLGIEDLGNNRFKTTFGESGRGVIWALARLILKQSYEGNEEDWALAIVEAREAVQNFKKEVPNLVQPGGYLEAEIKNGDWSVINIQAKK